MKPFARSFAGCYGAFQSRPLQSRPSPRRTLRSLLPIALAVMATHAANAQQPGQVIAMHLDPAQTHIQWTLKTSLHPVRGTFDLKGGLVTFDPSTGEAQGELIVELTTGKSGDNGRKESRSRDQKMQNDVLESAKYPEAIFHPTRITGSLKPGSAQPVSVEGTFTIHGADHPLIMRGTIERSESSAKANLTFTIPYVDWGMKDPGRFPVKVASTVDVTVDAQGRLDHPAN